MKKRSRMKTGKRGMRLISLFIFIAACFPVYSSGEEKPEKILPHFYKNWLEKDVVYIITPREKDVFLQLETDKERDIFVAAFWKQRDPIPGTQENEFKEEHYRRIAYANEFFGRETTRLGWQTDRGRMYILLGPPQDTINIEGKNFVHQSIIWSFEGKPEYGFPSHFHLVFFKRRGMGEFVLYSPTVDGPAGLIVNFKGDTSDIMAAYKQILSFDSRLADVSVSLIPGESLVYGYPSVASDMLLNRIGSLPEKTINWKYAEALLKFKDVIEVEYSTNYIASESLAQVIRDESGYFFIHYSLEPKKLSLLSFKDVFNMHFILNGIATDREGRVVFQYEKTIPLKFSREQVEDVGKTSIVLQDMVPVISGEYRFNVLLKNTVSKEFTSAEWNISVPQDSVAFGISPLLLGYKITKDASLPRVNKPFQAGDYQISCQAGNLFHPKENLYVFFQLYGLDDDLRRDGKIKFTFIRKEEEFITKTIDMRELKGRDILQEFSLRDFPPDNYRIHVSVLDGRKKEILRGDARFGVTSLVDLARPWVISRVMPASHNIEYEHMIGSQFARAGRLTEARGHLEKAYENDSDSLKFAVSFGQILFDLNEYRKAKEILLPFVGKRPENYSFLSLLGASSQALGEYEEAISYYKDFLAHFGTTLAVLNSLGECYYQMGDFRQAAMAWEKSLEMDPHQEALRKRVDQIKRK